MISKHSSETAWHWQQQANAYLLQGDYSDAALLYEQAIALEPEVKLHYWYLGLMLLLQEQEVEAETTWLLGMAEGEEEEIKDWTVELVEILLTEARRQESLKNFHLAWTIRQHIREIIPDDINNLLHSTALSIELETFASESLVSLGIIELLESEQGHADCELLLLVLQKVLNYISEDPIILRFTEACLHQCENAQGLIDVVMLAALKIGYSARRPTLASRFAEICLKRDPKHTEVLRHLAFFYQDSYQYAQGIETAKLYYAEATSLTDKIIANYVLLRGLMCSSGYWDEAYSTLEDNKELMLSLVEANPSNLEQTSIINLFGTPFFFPYFKDDPKTNRYIHNQISDLCYKNFKIYGKDVLDKYPQRKINNHNKIVDKKVLKIGYISNFLRRHSVGWITRWLFQYHNREDFQIHTYLVGYLGITDFVQNWFVNNSYKTYRFELPDIKVLEQIYNDEIDILVDLDSLTFPSQYEILSPKPAPIQVTWLGWDATGLPSIDYFIADPYVLPDDAQDYYTEKIWRLPSTYVAVNGFEVGVPTIRRQDLNIPTDAVIYFVGQRGYKRNLDNAKLQMRILKEVPSSYLLIKGEADEELSKSFFEEVAEEIGVSCDRLRFLPTVTSEEIHRANLGIADVVLDTYPYNGATTTLETLWMGLPLVTRVGEQFAARNSYTMMMNVGVTEGIAWTDEEYIEWGIRLGKDAALRQQISWRLRQSRQTSPLWDAKQFTREMEKAYQQMWQIYIDAS